LEHVPAQLEWVAESGAMNVADQEFIDEVKRKYFNPAQCGFCKIPIKKTQQVEKYFLSED
jgi:hypothetical protein